MEDPAGWGCGIELAYGDVGWKAVGFAVELVFLS